MEQKKKNEKDVLVVRDEKTGEISVVAGLDSKGYPKTAPAKAEHSQDFLRFDRHGDVVDNFFRNFYRQCKEPTRFGFYRVAADMADAVLPVIKDLLKDPAANAEMLAAHKVDTSEYQKQAETENVKQESDNEPLKKTEEMEQKKEEQKQEVQQPQTAEAQDEQQPQKQEKQNLIADDQVDWEELRKCGIDREKLSEKDLKALMNYGKTGLVTVKPTFGYESYELQARLSFQKAEDGKLKLTPHFIRDAPRLDVPYKGYSFTDEDRNNLKHTGNLGKMVSVADERTGEFRPSYISIDRLTNEIVDVPANKVRIPDKIGLTPVSSAEKDILRAGLALPKEVTLKNGRKFHALLQVNADKRDVEFVPGQKIRIRHNGWRTAGGGKTMTRPTRSRTKGTKATGSGNAATARGRTRTAASVPSKMERRHIYRTANQGLRSGQDGGACQRERRPRAALYEVPEVQLRERASADLLAESRPCADRRPVEREQDAACREQRGQDQRGHQAREGAVAAGSDRTKGRNPAETADQEIQRHEGVLIAATKSIRQ